jgi:hypothetical protein
MATSQTASRDQVPPSNDNLLMMFAVRDTVRGPSEFQPKSNGHNGYRNVAHWTGIPVHVSRSTHVLACFPGSDPSRLLEISTRGNRS